MARESCKLHKAVAIRFEAVGLRTTVVHVPWVSTQQLRGVGGCPLEHIWKLETMRLFLRPFLDQNGGQINDAHMYE